MFGNVLLCLASLCQIWKKSKCPKRHILGIKMTVYSVMHLKLKHALTSFEYFYRLNARNDTQVSFFIHNAHIKGSYTCVDINSDPLFVSVDVMFLLFDRISWKLSQIMRK